MDQLSAERTILGAMLLGDEAAIMDASAVLHYSDFSLGSHQDIFSCIVGMAEARNMVDLTTVPSKMGKVVLDRIGGISYLADLTSGIPRRVAIAEHLETILDRSLARRGLSVCHAASERLLDPMENAKEVLDALAVDLMSERPEDSTHVSAVVSDAMRFMDAPLAAIPTGIREIDEMTLGGMRPKELWVIGAKPSGGKSSLCRQIERSFLNQGHGVHSHSIEVPKEDWTAFHVANLAGVPAWKIRQSSFLSPAERINLGRCADKVRQWPQMIDDAGSVHIKTLLAKSRLTAMRRKPKLFTVDYLQMIKGDDRDIRVRTGEICRALKVFAKEYGVTVLLLSQMKRTGDPNARPTVEDLKESGDIEAAADVIILNYRPKEEDQYKPNTAELIVGKQRNGPVGTNLMHYDTSTLTFESRTA